MTTLATTCLATLLAVWVVETVLLYLTHRGAARAESPPPAEPLR